MFGDVVKTFGKNFLAADLAPAAFFVIASLIFTLTGFFPEVKPEYLDYLTSFGIPRVAALLIIVGFLALALGQLNIPIIRFYEGYYKPSGYGKAIGFIRVHFD